MEFIFSPAEHKPIYFLSSFDCEFISWLSPRERFPDETFSYFRYEYNKSVQFFLFSLAKRVFGFLLLLLFLLRFDVFLTIASIKLFDKCLNIYLNFVRVCVCDVDEK